MNRKAFLALLLVFCTFSPALAQTTPAPSRTPAQTPATAPPPPPQKPDDDKDDVVRITTNLVQVDAVVTKDGKPVTNLTADDFEIYEDGRKQTITSFTYVSNVPNTPPPRPSKEANKNDVVPFTQINPEDPHRTIAFVVDDLGLSFESMGRVRNQLRKYIAEQTQPNDLIAIIRTGGEMGALQQFTNDKRLLGRAVDLVRWNPCSRVGVHVFRPQGFAATPACGRRSLANTMNSLRFIVDSMGQLPGRKSMIILSDSLPVETQDVILDRGVLREESIVENDASASPLIRDSTNYGAFLQKIAEKAIRSSVVIYSVDTQGLATVDLTAADMIRGNYYQQAEQIRNLRTARMDLLLSRREGGDLLARQTGGFQVRNTNSLELNRIVEDQSGYYLLGYRPSEETFNRKFHKIKAKVKRSGMSLRTRYGFFGVTEEEAKNMKLTPRDITNLALASPFRAQDIEVDLTSFFADEPQTGAMVRSYVYLNVEDLEFGVVNGKRQGSIEIHSAIFGDNGRIVDQFKRGATVTFSDVEFEHAKANGMGMGINMPVKGHGSYQVRLVVRDRNSSKIGSAAQFVMVPNLKDKKLAVSGVVLGTLDQASGPSTADQAIVNPGSRKFAPNSDLYFAYRLYNSTIPGGTQLRNMALQARIFRDGKSVYSAPEVPITAGTQKDLTRIFGDGTVKLSPDLEPGNYYLQVVITDKDAKKDGQVVQWVDFEIAK